MKKHILALGLLLLSVSTTTFAQYAKGDITVNAGLSLGVFSYAGWGAYGNSSGFLPLFLNGEYSLNDKIAVGPYLGYYGRSFKSGDYKTSFSAVSYGVRGTLHASQFLNEALDLSINEEKIDVYVSAMMGFDTYTWKYDENWVGDKGTVSSTDFDFGTILGMRYNFTPKTGAFVELGRGTFGIATIGASLKL